MLWSAIRRGSGVKEDISTHAKKKKVTGDAAYIPSELSVGVARTLCLFGYWSVSPYLTCLFVLVRLRCLMTVSGSFSGPSICIFESC